MHGSKGQNKGANSEEGRKRTGFTTLSAKSWNWIATDDGGGRVIETGAVLESVGVENETFFSYEVESGATSGAEEASCGEGRACEEEDAPREPAQL